MWRMDIGHMPPKRVISNAKPECPCAPVARLGLSPPAWLSPSRGACHTRSRHSTGTACLRRYLKRGNREEPVHTS